MRSRTLLFLFLATGLFAYAYYAAKKDFQSKLSAAQTALKESGQKIQTLESTLKTQGELIASLQKSQSAQPLPTPTTVSVEKGTTSEPAPVSSPSADEEFRLRARISAIEKFVPLSDIQREKLKAKFSADAGDTTETLEDILGKESAEYYRSEMGRAFQKAKEEDEEKEVLFMSRQLGLSEEQEARVRVAMTRAEEEVEAASKGADSNAKGMESRLRAMMNETKARQDALNRLLAEILTPEQYRRYLEQEAASSASDFQVFHEPSQ